MLKYLTETFDSWCEVAEFMHGVSSLNGWYAFWEGCESSDFSFCSNNPHSDSTGEHITEQDFTTESRK